MKKRNIHFSEQQRHGHLAARNALEKAGRLAFKERSSAKWTDISRSWNGTVLVQIEHDRVKDVTPEMIRWWFENLARTTNWNGVDFSGPEISFYHLWHCRDHIALTPLNSVPGGPENHGFQQGADSRIEERFNEVHFHVHTVMHTTKLDNHEFTFLITAGGIPFGRITHLYEQEEDGCSFYAETEMGSRIPVIGWLINWLLLPFVYNKKTAWNWITHNVEETGRTEDVLPILYAKYAKETDNRAS